MTMNRCLLVENLVGLESLFEVASICKQLGSCVIVASTTVWVGLPIDGGEVPAGTSYTVVWLRRPLGLHSDFCCFRRKKTFTINTTTLSSTLCVTDVPEAIGSCWNPSLLVRLRVTPIYGVVWCIMPAEVRTQPLILWHSAVKKWIDVWAIPILTVKAIDCHVDYVQQTEGSKWNMTKHQATSCHCMWTST